jgi:hypothetical protein
MEILAKLPPLHMQPGWVYPLGLALFLLVVAGAAVLSHRAMSRRK